MAVFDNASGDENKATNAQTFVLSLNVLKEIKDKQSQHGLKHGDYNRYRTYCSKRLQRLRRSLKQTSSRSKTMYLKHVLNQMIIDAVGVKREPVRYLLIPLFSAERAWSYAMALKQEGDTRKKFHMIKRFHKAVVYAKNLEKLCNEEPTVCDIRTKLESQAYSAFIFGLYLFEREDWNEASENLKKCQAIYTRLIESVADESDLKTLYEQRINELKPTLRYCAFNLNEKGAKDFIEKFNPDDVQDEFLAKKLDALLIQERGKKSAQLSEVSWLGKQIPVSKDLIRSFLLDVEQVLLDQQVKMNNLEKKLFESRDCLQALKEAGQEKSCLYMYVSYLRQKLICKRNVEIIKGVKNATDKVRPYETIISSLAEIEALPLEQYFEDSVAQVAELRNKTEAETLAFKAMRCFQIGCTGWLDWKKSIAMLHKCGQYAESALNTSFLDDNLIQEVQELRLRAESSKFNLYGENADDQEEPKKPEKDVAQKKRVLIDHLDEFVEVNKLEKVPKLTHLPPSYEPVPFKPMLFDLAFNHIAFPSLDEEMGLLDKKAGTGLSGFVKNLFWK